VAEDALHCHALGDADGAHLDCIWGLGVGFGFGGLGVGGVLG